MTWPLQSKCDAFYGNPRGKNGQPSLPWELANLTHIVPPFQMTYDSHPIKSVRIHEKCADSLSRVFDDLWRIAGQDQKIIDQMGVSIFGGSYNFRLMRNGTRLSMHSYGCAIDLDPANNQLGDTTPRFQKWPQVYAAFEKEGWVWGGRWKGKGCDGMHFQAAIVG